MTQKALNELTAIEIRELLNSEGEIPFRPCQLAERLGELALDGEQRESAQNGLIPFLESGCPRSRFIGAKHLYRARDENKATEATIAALQRFEQDEDNEDIVAKLGQGQAEVATIPVNHCSN